MLAEEALQLSASPVGVLVRLLIDQSGGEVSRLDTRLPEVLPYLALPPGWRFLLAPDYQDVWFDESLLDVSGE